MPKSLDAFARRYLYEFMDARDLINFGRTCKSFYGECMHADAWKGRIFVPYAPPDRFGRNRRPMHVPEIVWEFYLRAFLAVLKRKVGRMDTEKFRFSFSGKEAVCVFHV